MFIPQQQLPSAAIVPWIYTVPLVPEAPSLVLDVFHTDLWAHSKTRGTNERVFVCLFVFSVL